MAANNYCQWCGRKYDSINSTASDPGYFVANVVKSQHIKPELHHVAEVWKAV